MTWKALVLISFIVVFIEEGIALAQIPKKKDYYAINLNLFSSNGTIGQFSCVIDSGGNFFIANTNSSQIFIFSKYGKVIDSIDISSNPARMFVNSKNQLILYDTKETNIYKYNPLYKKVEKISFEKPEVFYRELDEMFINYFDNILHTFTYYFDTLNVDMKYEYGTRFNYNYNFFPLYKKREIYQVLNGVIYKIYGKNDIYMKSNYINGVNFFHSQELNYKSQLIFFDAENKIAIYQKNAKLTFEDLKESKITELNFSEKACYCAYPNKNKIIGVSNISKNIITISGWEW